MLVHCTHFGHVKKSKTFNIHLRMVEQNNKRLPKHPFSCRLWICLCWYIFHHKSSFVKVSYILFNHQSVGYISMLCIQFHWQFLIISSGFRFVNILLRKFDTSSEKEMKMIKTQIFWLKTTKRCRKSICKHKVAFFTLNVSDWPVM